MILLSMQGIKSIVGLNSKPLARSIFHIPLNIWTIILDEISYQDP